MFPVANRFLGFNTEDIEHNWNKLKNSTIKTEDQYFKPYALMEFKMRLPLDAHCAHLFDESYIYRKIQMDHAFIMNFAHPIADPNCALLLKVIKVITIC